MSNEFIGSVQETIAYGLLRRGRDVLIVDLYREMKQLRPDAPLTGRDGQPIDTRLMQSIVGAVVHRINRKIKDRGWEIRPGEARRTYRRYKLEAVD